jgi:hypothetical protein
MYIESSEKVKEFFCEYEDLKLEEKISSSIYIFNSFGNNQINSLNDYNPDKLDSDIDIFNLNILGFPNDSIDMIIDYLKYLLKHKKIKSENRNKFLSKYEKLNFVEKIDVITEIIIRIDNETLIDDVWFPRLDSNLSGFDIALIIKEYKNNL